MQPTAYWFQNTHASYIVAGFQKASERTVAGRYVLLVRAVTGPVQIQGVPLNRCRLLFEERIGNIVQQMERMEAVTS